MGIWAQRLRLINATQWLAIILIVAAASLLGVKKYSNSAYESYEAFLTAVEDKDIPDAIVLSEQTMRKADRMPRSSESDFVRLQLGVAEGLMILGAAGPAGNLYLGALENIQSADPIAPQFPAFDTADIFRVHLGLVAAMLRERTPDRAISHIRNALKFHDTHADVLSGSEDGERLFRLLEELSNQIGDVDELEVEQVEELLSLSRALEDRGKSGPSARLQEAAVKSLDGAIENPDLVARLSVGVADYYLDIERPGKAEDYIDRAFRILSSKFGSQAPQMLPYTALQGRFLTQTGDPRAAIEILEEALETVELFGDPDMPGSIEVVEALEGAYEAAGEDRERKKLNREFGWMVDMERFVEAEDEAEEQLQDEQAALVLLDESPLEETEAVGDDHWLEFKVLYGTSRRRADSTSTAKFYTSRTSGRSGERGWVKVALPLEPNADPFAAGGGSKSRNGEYITLHEMNEQSKEDFLFDLNERVLMSSHSETFVFVHGHGVSFDDAARQTARLAHELKFDGVPVFYSWPAEGTKFGYLADIHPDPQAMNDFRLFVDEVIDHSGAEKIHFIAYGVGARILLTTLDEIGRENSGRTNWSVDEVILSVPDMTRSDFLNKADGAGKVAGRVTLYASNQDPGLKLAKLLDGRPRAGDTTYRPPVANDVDTIDVSIAGDTNFLPGRGMGASTILTDMRALIWHDLSPSERCMLEAQSRKGLWAYDADLCDAQAFDLASRLVFQQGATRANETINGAVDELNAKIAAAGTEARRRQIDQLKQRYLEAGRHVSATFRKSAVSEPVVTQDLQPLNESDGEAVDEAEKAEDLEEDLGE